MLRLVLTVTMKKLFDVAVQWLYHDLTRLAGDSVQPNNTQNMLNGIKIRRGLSPDGFPAFPVHPSSDGLFIGSDLLYKH